MKRNGFTLVELLVVISILGLLAMVTIPRFGGFRERAIQTTTMAELQAVRQAWNYYEIEFGENSLDCAEDLNLFLGDDLVGNVFLERYELDKGFDNGNSFINASVLETNAGENGHDKQRNDAKIFIDKIELE